jgi:nucleoside-diphosphate-sugar epimerase
MNELARVLAGLPKPRGVHFSLAGQQANSLLSDGHAWKGFERSALAGARRAARAGEGLLVHASFAFVQRMPARDPLRSLAQAILDCEDLVLSSGKQACVVRLGYLYGPQSADLRAYRTAFRLGRPYWAGPAKALQHHLHFDDAAAALLAAARKRNAGRVFYATGGRPASFRDFMDHFARRVGRRFPLHAPRISRPVMRLIIREEHMQQVAHAMPARTPAPLVPGWRPVFTDHRAGLDQAVAAWLQRGR